MKKCEFCNKPYYSSIQIKGIGYNLGEKLDSTNEYLIDLKENGEAKLLFKRSFDYEPWTVGECQFNYCPICGRKLVSNVKED